MRASCIACAAAAALAASHQVQAFHALHLPQQPAQAGLQSRSTSRAGARHSRGAALWAGGGQQQQPEAHQAPAAAAQEKVEWEPGKLHLTFVTGNKKKLEECRMIVAATNMPIQIVNRDIDLPEFQGDPIYISQEKCKLAAERVGGAVMVEDTSLCFNALNGLPGPYIKWFIELIGNPGIWNMLLPYEDKSVYAQCSLSFSLGPGCEPRTFVGRADGTLTAPTGDFGFGWDQLFVPVGRDVTLAQMTKEEKNTMSHRSRALGEFARFLDTEIDSLLAEQAAMDAAHAHAQRHWGHA